MKSLKYYEIILLSLTGALATLPRIKYGWSPLDDGFYAYVASHLMRGEVLHKDFFTQYIGYQHFLHAALFNIFGENYLVLRYPLPFFNFLSSISACFIFRQFGRIAQILGIIIVVGFSYLLFNNPSTSWTCECIALGISAIMMAPKYRKKNDQSTWIFIGILLGLTLGIRHPTAVFIGMGVVVAILLSLQKSQPRKKSTTNIIVPATALVALAVYAWKSGPLIDLSIWFVAPLSYLCLAIARAPRIASTKAFLFLASATIGLIIGILPAILYTSLTHSWRALAADLTAFPANYSYQLGTHSWYLVRTIIAAVLGAPSLATISSSLVMVVCICYPLYVFFKVSLFLSSPIKSTRANILWIKSPLTIITTFHCLVILGLIRDMYLSYSMPLIMLSLLHRALLSNHSFLTRTSLSGATVAASLTAFFVMSSRLGGSNALGFLGVGHIPWESCSAPRCDLIINKYVNEEVNKKIINKVNMIKSENSTITFIPWGYDYDFSAQPKNETAMPDTRIPFYKGATAAQVFSGLITQPDPIFVVNKAYSTSATIKQDFASIIASNSRKLYEDELFIIYKPYAKKIANKTKPTS